jgi:hypothetical protein
MTLMHAERVAVLSVICFVACADGGGSVCGDKFLDDEAVGRLSRSGEHDKLAVCLSAPSEEVVVGARSVGDLTVSGSSPARLIFPDLESVNRLFVEGCGFRELSFPALEHVTTAFFGCPGIESGSFDVALGGGVTEIAELLLNGAVSFRAPALEAVGRVVFTERDGGSFETSSETTVVDLSISAYSDLTAVSLPTVIQIDELELISTYNDFVPTTLPSLRRLSSLEASITTGLTRCSIDRLIGQLDAAPIRVSVDDDVIEGPCPGG